MAGLSSTEGHAMHKNGNFSDFKITCGDREWHVHRNILAGAGDFFRVTVSKDLKEAADAHLDFPQTHPIVVDRALVFIYVGGYSDDLQTDYSDISHPKLGRSISTVPIPSSSYELNFRIYEFAEMYCLDRLRSSAHNKFMEKAITSFNCVEFKPALKIVYEESSKAAEGLRLAVTRLCITKHKEVESDPELLEIIKRHEGMAFRYGVFDIKNEDIGNCYSHKSRLDELQENSRLLMFRIRDRTSCDDCGAQYALAVQKNGDGFDLSCSDCSRTYCSIR